MVTRPLRCESGVSNSIRGKAAHSNPKHRKNRLIFMNCSLSDRILRIWGLRVRVPSELELTVQRTGPKFALCVLRPGVTDHAQIDLLIGTGNETVKFSVSGGSAKVHITGYEVLEETYDGFGDDDDSDDDEDDDEFGEVPGGDDDDDSDDDDDDEDMGGGQPSFFNFGGAADDDDSDDDSSEDEAPPPPPPPPKSSEKKRKGSQDSGSGKKKKKGKKGKK